MGLQIFHALNQEHYVGRRKMERVGRDMGRDSLRHTSLTVASFVVSYLGKPRLQNRQQLIEGFVEIVWKKTMLLEHFEKI
jgi:hypothetical protein